MALPIRHFKLGFNSELYFWGAKQKAEDEEITGLFSFVVRGMKFSYDCVIDESDGQQLPNGTWTGIKGLLNRSEVDYAPASLMVTEEDYDAMAYNYPYASDELVFATRKPEYSPDIMALFRTLSPNVWISLLACIILVTLACFVAMKRRCTLGDILLHVLAIGLNQEGNLVPTRAGEVLLLSTWTVAMAVFTFCFKSVLLSFLTFPPVGGVRTVPELANAIRAGQYIAFTHRDRDFASYLQRSPNGDLRVIGESMLKNPRFFSYNFFDDKPPYPNEAFVHRRSYLSSLDGMLYVSKDNMGVLNFATAVRKGFCCKDEMDMLVHRFLGAGIDIKIDRYRNHLYAYRNHLYAQLSWKLPDDSENTLRKITVTDISGALIILVAGHCLSLCVLIIECWVKRRKRRRS